jgi:heme exporter protein D
MWNSPGDFFAMGGYALYVWFSFGICAAVLVLEPIFVRMRRQKIIKRLRHEILADEFDQEEKH